MSVGNLIDDLDNPSDIVIEKILKFASKRKDILEKIVLECQGCRNCAPQAVVEGGDDEDQERPCRLSRIASRACPSPPAPMRVDGTAGFTYGSSA